MMLMAALGAAGAAGAMGPLDERLLAAVDRATQSPLTLVAGLAVAAAVGALHAVGPGHGKTITASVVAGSNSTRRDAVWLAAAVALMHTFSALLLGLLIYAVTAGSSWVDDAGRWLRVITGASALGVGAAMLYNRRRANPHHHSHDPAHAHKHAHDHVHEHAHDHVHEHGHDGLAVPTRRVTGLWLVGLSGGLVPSPSALLVLLTGLFTGRIAYALALVVAFGLGMAATLTAVGLTVGAVRDRVQQSARGARLASALPVIGAAGVLVAGTVLTVSALVSL